jgi:uncharacterized protein YndB with AHSA1/START domain
MTTDANDVPDRIEKRILVKAPRGRVWRALADADAFGKWFGVELDGAFVVGKTMRGTFDESLRLDHVATFERSLGLEPTPTKLPEPNAVFCTVERIEPETAFAFRWIPYGIDATVDPAHEPTTRVEFLLDEAPGGTQITIVESGFRRVPAHRRRRAFLMNDAGWAAQAESIAKHVEAA